MKSTTIRMMTLLSGLISLAALTVPLRAGAFEPPKDPCSVLTPLEVSGALGSNSEPKHVVATLCQWEASGQSSDTHGKKLTLGFLSASAWEQTKALREQYMKTFTRTNIDGLGEEAVFSTNGTICTLQVKKGPAVLDMHLYGFPPDQAKDKEITLARAALGRF
jgi:hypothetical protein